MIDKLTGRVKWFDTRLGYGFIEYIENDLVYDIFIHYSTIISDSSFKKLNKNDEVKFELLTKSNVASNVENIDTPNDEWEII